MWRLVNFQDDILAQQGQALGGHLAHVFAAVVLQGRENLGEFGIS
ncbi:MAG TPA: hypothetical protein VEV85_02965 [Bryobacteraceae bacterium]|nr:hypothetical protein [Bryobacteraceae bacterium]